MGRWVTRIGEDGHCICVGLKLKAHCFSNSPSLLSTASRSIPRRSEAHVAHLCGSNVGRPKHRSARRTFPAAERRREAEPPTLARPHRRGSRLARGWPAAGWLHARAYVLSLRQIAATGHHHSLDRGLDTMRETYGYWTYAAIPSGVCNMAAPAGTIRTS